MRRRDFLAFVGAGAMTWSDVASSQQADHPSVIGFLTGASENDALTQARLAAFRNALQEVLGWTEGHNVRFEVR